MKILVLMSLAFLVYELILGGLKKLGEITVRRFIERKQESTAMTIINGIVGLERRNPTNCSVLSDIVLRFRFQCQRRRKYHHKYNFAGSVAGDFRWAGIRQRFSCRFHEIRQIEFHLKKYENENLTRN